MEILSAQQIRAWDSYTMEHEPISSVDLMERAATVCYSWLEQNDYLSSSFSIFCGKGNNGGDGLALARLLSAVDCPVAVYILEFGHKGSDDFQINLARLHQTSVEIKFIQSDAHFHPLSPADIVIDALFGSGLNRRLEGIAGELVDYINASGNKVISIDIPSGLLCDSSSKGYPCIYAAHTLSFQCFKQAFLMPENGRVVGEVIILDIGLDRSYLSSISTLYELVDPTMISDIFRPRKIFSHKGSYGHALLVAGSYGKMGAAVLSARACLRAGAGLLSCHIPVCGYPILQIALPEAMIETDIDERVISTLPADVSKYSAIGIGPGIGVEPPTKTVLAGLLKAYAKPLVIDADALNILASDVGLISLIPPYSILTPHPKEFERLFGPSDNDYARIKLASDKAKELQVIIVLKGHYTFIAMPGGKAYFNSTGNAGMAKGGSGDVLTGILTALLSQGYSAGEAAILGVYLHGMAGDLAAADLSQESMLASELTEYLGKAYLMLAEWKGK